MRPIHLAPLALLGLTGCKSLITVSELFGEWDMILQRVTVGEAPADEVVDAGFINFDETTYYAWNWLYDPVEGDFYAQLDPPILSLTSTSNDLDEPAPFVLEYAGGELSFLPERREDGSIWLVTQGVEWGLDDLLTIEVLLEKH